jgi:carbamoyl-phosphate synthase large subunit
VKPRIGSGSRGIRQVTVEELHTVPTDGEWLIQELLPGMEYSVDVLIGPSGAELAAVPRERLKVDSGVAVAARTVRDSALQTLAFKAAKAAGIRGVANVQFKRDRNGAPKLMEINPRFPGTMSLTVAAGANLPELVVTIADGQPVVAPQWNEVAIVRTLATHVVDTSFDAALQAAG